MSLLRGRYSADRSREQALFENSFSLVPLIETLFVQLNFARPSHRADNKAGSWLIAGT